MKIRTTNEETVFFLNFEIWNTQPLVIPYSSRRINYIGIDEEQRLVWPHGLSKITLQTK